LTVAVTDKKQKNPPDVIEVRVCVTEGVNIRTGPGVNYEKDSTGQLVKGEELYVLEERDGWIRFRCTPQDRGWSGWVNREFTVSKEEWDRAQEEAAIEEQEKAIKELTKAGLLVRINPDLNQAYVEPGIWHALDYQAKEYIARVMAFYRGRKKGTNLNWVDIKDRYSGKTLAKYSESWGFKVY